MAFFVNLNDKFKLAEGVEPDGSMLLASALPSHTLLRRNMKKFPNLDRRLFDPQLYMAGISANSDEMRKVCAKLASYPWFGVGGLGNFKSGEVKQAQWMAEAKRRIGSSWPSNAPQTDIADRARECIEFQRTLGCEAIILPSPLTTEPGTNYHAELEWLDAGLRHVHSLREGLSQPVYATVALSDLCLRLIDAGKNPLLDLIIDQVSAREVDGVYIVVEQTSESTDTKHCSHFRTLWSVLRLVHEFASDAELSVGVNFMGVFGLACEAAGASWWASNWYKSLYRLRLQDKIAGGRAYPTYWCHPLILDINMASDFDSLARAGLLASYEDWTPASEGLLEAAKAGVSASSVGAWTYSPSNVTAAKDHFLLSAIAHEQQHSKLSGKARLQAVVDWFEAAMTGSTEVVNELGAQCKTRLDHVQAWHDAIAHYRNDHDV